MNMRKLFLFFVFMSLLISNVKASAYTMYYEDDEEEIEGESIQESNVFEDDSDYEYWCKKGEQDAITDKEESLDYYDGNFDNKIYKRCYNKVYNKK
ncbi:MAG: hypothetical protein Ta2D_03700 [Rickettsiales bacterium]|nr:MAG: hypothetical protein Ta2D_03700 [Rickettsiales bacterium]